MCSKNGAAASWLDLLGETLPGLGAISWNLEALGGPDLPFIPRRQLSRGSKTPPLDSTLLGHRRRVVEADMDGLFDETLTVKIMIAGCCVLCWSGVKRVLWGAGCP